MRGKIRTSHYCNVTFSQRFCAPHKFVVKSSDARIYSRNALPLYSFARELLHRSEAMKHDPRQRLPYI
jgi:hypothetical protein